MRSRRFYFDLYSPYAYLAAHRVDDVVGPDVEWVPIAFGPLLVQTGREPWSWKEDRAVGMRECEQRAERYGLPPIRWPEGWPRESYTVYGARAALAAKQVGRERELSRALFDRIFTAAGRLDDPAVLAAAGEEAGVDDLAQRMAGVKQELRAVTDDAIARGVTGIPTIEANGTLFWGDDRLEEAAAA